MSRIIWLKQIDAIEGNPSPAVETSLFLVIDSDGHRFVIAGIAPAEYWRSKGCTVIDLNKVEPPTIG